MDMRSGALRTQERIKKQCSISEQEVIKIPQYKINYQKTKENMAVCSGATGKPLRTLSLSEDNENNNSVLILFFFVKLIYFSLFLSQLIEI